MGRVVIRAIKAFVDGGGSWDDVDRLKDTARFGDDAFGFGDRIREVTDPLGYVAETAKTVDDRSPKASARTRGFARPRAGSEPVE
jgi:hypothetical protein